MIYLIENWYVYVSLLALVVFVGTIVYKYFKLPNSKQIQKVKEWLLYVVVEAEKSLGGQTGRLKLRFCYDAFIQRFKWTSRLITFEMFSLLVDEALEEMREMLSTNPSVVRYVEQDK